MRRKFLPIAIVGCLLCIVSVMAQDYFYAYYKDGTFQKFPTENIDSISLVPADTVIDACGNVYRVVTIGTQVWMAENLRCNKYDSNSKQAGKVLDVVDISEFNAAGDPYYAVPDIFGMSTFYRYRDEKYKDVVGYKYSYSAALGYKSAADAYKDTSLPSSLQGICPNGWHIPTKEDFQTLLDYVNNTDRRPGRALKVVYEWCDGNNNSNDACEYSGYDLLGFSFIPYANGNLSIIGATKVTKNSPAKMQFSVHSLTVTVISASERGSVVRCLKD